MYTIYSRQSAFISQLQIKSVLPCSDCVGFCAILRFAVQEIESRELGIVVGVACLWLFPSFFSAYFERSEQGEMQSCMNERIWGRLPQGLMDAVLAHLPISVLLRLRAVCKRWDGLLSSPDFLDLWSQVPQQRSYFLFCERDFDGDRDIDDGLIFCPSSNFWYRLPLKFLPFSVYEIMDVTGGGGLLFVCSDSKGSEMVVANPVTKAWRMLPSLRAQSRPSLAALVVNKSRGTYTIVVAYNSDMTTHVYESSTNVWTQTATLPFDAPMRPIVCNGVIYCVGDDITRIGAYDIEKGLWSTFKALFAAQLRFMDSHFAPKKYAQLAESCDRLFLITMVQESASTVGFLLETGMISSVRESATTGSIHVWQVWPERQKNKSKLVEKMPDNLRVHFKDGFDVIAYANAEHKDALLFIAWGAAPTPASPSPDSWERSSSLIYDLVEKSWEWTRPPLVSQSLPEDGFNGFPLELSLTSLP